MNRFVQIILSVIMLSACSTGESGLASSSEDQGIPVAGDPSAKPVIALMPVEVDQGQDIASTLGSAYQETLIRMLDNMQTYDVRPIPTDYSLEDLQGRGYDNILQSRV